MTEMEDVITEIGRSLSVYSATLVGVQNSSSELHTALPVIERVDERLYGAVAGWDRFPVLNDTAIAALKATRADLDAARTSIIRAMHRLTKPLLSGEVEEEELPTEQKVHEG